jgi:uncharacterized membrane protein YcaP (DUF421 family)
MAEQTIPIWYGVIPLLVICVVHYVASIVTKRSPLMRDILSGKPAIVIDENGIDFKELAKLNISCEELLEALRNLDYFDMTEINYAIIERTGKITVIPKASNMPATRKDLSIVKPENDVFYCVVEGGRIVKKNFAEMGIPYDVVVRDILPKIMGGMRGTQPEDVKDPEKAIKKIAFCSLSESGDVYIQKAGEKAQNYKIKISPSDFTPEKLKQNARKENAL